MVFGTFSFFYRNRVKNILILILFLLISNTYADDFSWTGSGDNSTWSSSANWNNDTGISDFGGNGFPDGTDNATINATITITGTIGCNNLTVSGGTVSFGANGSFTGNISGAGTIDGSSFIINVGGNWSISNFTAGTSEVVFNGSGTQSMTTGGSVFYDFTVNKSAGSMSPTVSFDILNTLLLHASNSGTFSPSSGTIHIEGALTHSGGTFTASGTNIIEIPSGGFTISTASGMTFQNLTHNPNTGTQATASLDFTSGSSQTVTINGNFTKAARSGDVNLTNVSLSYGGSASLIYDLSQARDISNEWPSSPSSIPNIILRTNTITIPSGTLIVGTSLTRESGALTATGTLQYNSGSTLIYNSNTTTTIGDEWPTTNSPENVTMTLTGGSTLQSGSSFSPVIAKNLTINVGTLDLSGGTLTVAGSVSGSVVAGAATIASNTPLLLGNGSGTNFAQSISGTLTLTSMEIDKANGTNTVQMTGISALIFTGSSSLTITSGTLDLNGNARFTSAPNALTVASGAILQTGGTSLTGITTLTASAGTIVFDGSSQESLPTGITIGSLVINNSNGALTSSGTLTVNDLTLTSGIITTTSSNILLLSGSVTSVGGTPSGTAMIDGPLRWTVDDLNDHIFPVGDGSNYRPATFAFNNAPNDVIQIQYNNTAPGGNLPSGISTISTGGHYTLQRITGSTAVDYNLTLRYTDSGFSPEDRNNILVQNGSGPDYSVPVSQSVDQPNDDVTASNVNAFPTNSFILAFGAGGVTNTWTGGTGNWNVAGNWSATSIPSASDDVVISSGTVTIPSSYSPVAQSLAVQSSATLIFANTTGINFGSGWDAGQTTFSTGATVQYNSGSVYVDDYVNLTINGAANTSGSGTITVSGNMIKNSSTAFSTSEAISVTGTYTNTLGNATYNGNLTILGSPITLTSGTVGGTVILNGGSAQTVIGASVNFANLTLNNGNGFIFSNTASISGTLTLTDGIVNNGSNAITLGSGANVSGGSDAAHIDGPVRNTGTGSKTFPIGDNGNYRPVVTSFTGSTPLVQFQAFDATPNQSWDGTLDHISIVRYFLGSVESGSISGGSVTLSYESNDGVQDFNEAGDVVVAWSSDNSSDYTSEGGQSSGSPVSGTVTSTGTIDGNLGYFTLGTATGDNSLPVELTAFTATPAYDKVTLEWQTASEIDNLGFNVYRKSAEESQWQQANEQLINGQGNTSVQSDYSFVDARVVAGQKYSYKLESVSYNGLVNKEKIIEVNIPVPDKIALFNNYPNPFNPTTNIKFQLPAYSVVNLAIYDVNGKLVKELLKNAAYDAGQFVVTWNATDNFENKVSSGMYLYRFTSGNFTKMGRMLLIK